jgi:hypothetical protein
MNRYFVLTVIFLLGVIVLLSWLLWVKNAEAPSVSSPMSTETAQTEASKTDLQKTPAPKPLHARIVMSQPRNGAHVGPTFSIEGKAPGNWFFEGSAPFLVRTETGEKIAQGTIRAQGEWMTENLVDFAGDVSITGEYRGSAILVLIKDNPSGLPEQDDALEIPLFIK